MSELKEWTASEIEEYDDARLELAEDGKIDCTRVYIKADADEVISTIRAERDEYRYNLSCARNEIHNLTMSMREDVKTIADKDKVIAELQEKLKVQTSIAEEGWKEFRTYHTSYAEAVKELYDKNKELRYQKYKRCLAMAKWCASEAYIHEHGSDYDEDLVAWFGKWHNRWLKIAEQFKEAKQ